MARMMPPISIWDFVKLDTWLNTYRPDSNGRHFADGSLEDIAIDKNFMNLECSFIDFFPQWVQWKYISIGSGMGLMLSGITWQHAIASTNVVHDPWYLFVTMRPQWVIYIPMFTSFDMHQAKYASKPYLHKTPSFVRSFT